MARRAAVQSGLPRDGRDDWRLFRLDRMRLSGLPGAHYQPRTLPGDPADWAMDRFRNTPWACEGTVRMQAPAEFVAAWAMPGATIEPIDHEWDRVTGTAWNWVGLTGWVCSYDVPFVVEGPRGVREACAMLAGRLARAAAAETATDLASSSTG